MIQSRYPCILNGLDADRVLLHFFVIVSCHGLSLCIVIAFTSTLGSCGKPTVWHLNAAKEENASLVTAEEKLDNAEVQKVAAVNRESPRALCRGRSPCRVFELVTIVALTLTHFVRGPRSKPALLSERRKTLGD